MKPRISSLKLGQKVWATCEEVRPNQEILVNFEGDLLRVQNHSSRQLRVGQRLQLHVESTHPLKFRLVEAKRLQFGIDVEA
jgi:hypothetical protein